MAVHWVTFRIAEEKVGARTYDDRYRALIDAVNEHTTDAWDEPTSFWIIESKSTRSQIAASIKKAIVPTVDLALIGSMETTGATLVGKANKLEALKRLIPNLGIG